MISAFGTYRSNWSRLNFSCLAENVDSVDGLRCLNNMLRSPSNRYANLLKISRCISSFSLSTIARFLAMFSACFLASMKFGSVLSTDGVIISEHEIATAARTRKTAQLIQLLLLFIVNPFRRCGDGKWDKEVKLMPAGILLRFQKKLSTIPALYLNLWKPKTRMVSLHHPGLFLSVCHFCSPSRYITYSNITAKPVKQ